MKAFVQRIRAWYQRRFRGFVAPPAQHGGRGTSWQEHKRFDIGFTCSGKLPNGKLCGQVLAFLSSDLVVRAKDHLEGCDELMCGVPCNCPITDARHVKICANCGLGHWNDATPRLVDNSTRRLA